MPTLNIAAISINTTPLDLTGNLEIIKNAISANESKLSDILLFPELSLTGYGCEDSFYRSYLWENAFLKLEELKDLFPNKLLLVGLPVFKDGYLHFAILSGRTDI